MTRASTPEARGIREPVADVEADAEELVWGIIDRALGLEASDHGLMWPHAGLMTWLAPQPLTMFTGGYRPCGSANAFTPSALGSAFVSLLHEAKMPN